MERADALEKDGKAADAIALLSAHVRSKPEDGAAKLVLARLELDAGEGESARKLFDSLAEPDKESDAGKALAARFAFQEHAGELDALARKVEAAPSDLDARIAWGRALVAAGEHEKGLGVLLAAAQQDVHFDSDAPRKALVEAFGAIGWSNPLVRDHQRRLSLILAS
jgi:thioredoxin-like negative regulator of GroEL